MDSVLYFVASPGQRQRAGGLSPSPAWPVAPASHVHRDMAGTQKYRGWPASEFLIHNLPQRANEDE